MILPFMQYPIDGGNGELRISKRYPDRRIRDRGEGLPGAIKSTGRKNIGNKNSNPTVTINSNPKRNDNAFDYQK